MNISYMVIVLSAKIGTADVTTGVEACVGNEDAAEYVLFSDFRKTIVRWSLLCDCIKNDHKRFVLFLNDHFLFRLRFVSFHSYLYVQV